MKKMVLLLVVLLFATSAYAVTFTELEDNNYVEV